MSAQPAPPDVRIEDTPFGRVVTIAGPGGGAVVHEHGAHVTSWTPTADGGREALFLGHHARIDGQSAIRGGVPVIFPQFGPGPLPKHGFARTARWSLEDAGVDAAGVPFARLVLVDDAATHTTWPHAFAARLTVRVDDGLAITLAVENTGRAPLRFTGALHTYLRVADVQHVILRGLERQRLRDQLTRVEATEGPLPLRFAGPVDRVYMAVTEPLHVDDEVWQRTLRVTATGFPDVVVWNPWDEGARAIDDLDDAEWRDMLCVEAAVVVEPVTLAPGARWDGTQRLDVEATPG
jgi:glucose-6-phosphate 1-epimerase